MMVHKLEKMTSDTCRRINFDGELLGKSESLSIDPCSLVFSYKETAPFFFLLNFVEVVHDDTDEEIQNELGSDNHKENEEEQHADIVI